MFALVVVFSVELGCQDYETHFTYEEGGDLCVTNQGTVPRYNNTYGLSEFVPHWLTVQYEDCESGCMKVLHSECTAELDGRTIYVHARAEASLFSRKGYGCALTCVGIRAECPVQGRLVPGETYSIIYGEQRRDFSVPGTFECIATKKPFRPGNHPKHP